MLEVKNITKYYPAGKDKITGCKNISFNIETGEIASLLGLNGSGKSTIINCLTGNYIPNAGSVLLNNLSIFENEIEAKKLMGVLYEQNPLYGMMSVLDFLLFCAKMYGRKKENAVEIVNEVMQFCEIEDYANRIIKNLSKGYKQRVGLAQSIINNPKLLILDEPTSGLDAVQIKNIEKKILQISKGKAILMATHNLKQAINICSTHILINKGEIIAKGSIYEIREELEKEGCKFDSSNPEAVLEQAFLFFAGVNKNEFNKIESN